jgi:hypothetical protein
VVASEMGLRLGTVRALENVVVTNVVSHGFGVMAYDQSDDLVIANLVLAQEPLPRNGSATCPVRLLRSSSTSRTRPPGRRRW